jgi:hypothetical protein
MRINPITVTIGLLSLALTTSTASAHCWLTGGGTVDKDQGTPHFSFGGVVNPGCSPTAAGGGNWNVVDHQAGLHFKGLQIEVINCSGVPTKSPKSVFNIIDFGGVGTIVGIDGNSMAERAVCFRAQAVDKSEPGHDSDQLYLRVYDCDTFETLLVISATPDSPGDIAPVEISTGNLQIHPCKVP